MTILLIYLSISIGVSFFCSLFEAVILSVSPAYIASLVESGHPSGKLLTKLKTKLEDSLSAILTLNTVAHTLGAAGVGAEVLKLYGDEYVAIASIILTLLILVLSEILPKTLGATYWRKLAPFVAPGIQFFVFITYPFVISFQLLSRFLGSSSHSHAVTREEIAHAAELGQQEGSLSEDESAIIKNLLKLRKLMVRDILTPRTVVFALDQNCLVGEVLKQHPSIPFSRIPIYDENIDNIVGLVTRYEVVREQAEGRTETPLRDLAKSIHAVPDMISVARVFDTFIQRREHIFAVNDEHGSFDGLISLEDVIETLLGVEITDEYDSVEDMRAYAARKWKSRKAKLISST